MDKSRPSLESMLILWLTGSSGNGTIGGDLVKQLVERGLPNYILDTFAAHIYALDHLA